MIKKIRRQNGLRYYLYVSDTKLDMLFDQIAEQIRKKISLELKIDLKLASMTLSHAGSPEPARMAKLRLVEEFIVRNHTIGTVEDPSGRWFQGTMDMQWGWLESYDTSDASPLVFFRGREDSNLVMLAGSRRHVVGESPGTTVYAGSALPHIVAAVKAHFPGDAAITGLRSQDPAWTAPLRAREVLFNDAPRQKMSFLAVSLAEESIEGHRLLLGTPLYVALASLECYVVARACRRGKGVSRHAGRHRKVRPDRSSTRGHDRYEARRPRRADQADTCARYASPVATRRGGRLEPRRVAQSGEVLRD